MDQQSRTNKLSEQAVSNKRERPVELMDDEHELRESSKRTGGGGSTEQAVSNKRDFEQMDDKKQFTESSQPTAGYTTTKVPAHFMFPNLIKRTGGANFDKSKIPLRMETPREVREIAQRAAHHRALARARQSLPRFKPFDKDALTQKCRQSLASSYRECYRYGPMKDEKTCFWSGGGRYSWSELSSGITWVAVYGVDHTYAVSRRMPGLDPARLSDLQKVKPEPNQWKSFLHSVIAEIEDTSTTSAFYQKIDQSAKTSPFAVAPHVEESSSKASSVSLGEKQCHDFLDKTLKDGKVFSTDETVQIAISALQHLFCQKFKSEEIVAYHLGRSGVKSMLLLSNEEVEKHLA